MSDWTPPGPSRRAFIGAAATVVTASALPAFGQSGAMPNSTQMEPAVTDQSPVRHNISSFRDLSWQDYFSSTRNGMILVDITSRALHFWSEDLSVYKLYPCSVPMSPDLTRKGRTRVVEKVKNPTWRPTPAMKKRNPAWPDVIGPGPENPLGPRALYLSWQYYRIHGTQDTRKIGRASSNGCIGLYNEDILVLFKLAKVGTQVLLI